MWTCSPSNERSISGTSLPQLQVIKDAIVVGLQLKLVKPGKLNHPLSLLKRASFQKGI